MADASSADDPGDGVVPLRTVARSWGRIGCLGFGGPPAHIAMLRALCVTRRQWIAEDEFEHAIAACNLLPGPASTQLAIWSAWRVRGRAGAIVGGLSFIVPGLVAILALTGLFLREHPPTWVSGAAAGAGAAVGAVALAAAAGLAPASWRRVSGAARWRWLVSACLGAAGAVFVGPYLVVVIVLCGVTEVLIHRGGRTSGTAAMLFAPWRSTLAIAGTGGWPALAWTAVKVGALSYGGGFVIVPLMQSDAVSRHHWMSATRFLGAVALGQITPGPVVLTTAAVGMAAAGVGGGLLAAAVAFAPSFVFVLVGAPRFERLRHDATAQAFLRGAGPAAIGAICGSAVALARALGEPWQYAVLGGAVLSLFAVKRGIVLTLAVAAAAGVIVALAGGPLPR